MVLFIISGFYDFSKFICDFVKLYIVCVEIIEKNGTFFMTAEGSANEINSFIANLSLKLTNKSALLISHCLFSM
jgi:hypothetical protein